MFDFKSAAFAVRAFAKENAPAILTGVGISGTVVTAYFTGVAGYRTAKRLEEIETPETKREVILEVWDLYIPAAVSGLVTVACIFGANHIASNKTAAAYSLLALSEKAFEEYRGKVTEQIGVNKEQKIRDEIAQEKIQSNPLGNLILAQPDGVICCEMFTGRYFVSDMETIRQALNDVNAKLIREDYCTIGEMYYLLGLPQTSNSGRIGWTSDKLLKLEFSTVLTDDNKPCLAFDYNYVTPL